MINVSGQIRHIKLASMNMLYRVFIPNLYLNGGADNFSERFKKIKDKAFNDYMVAFSSL